MFPAHIRVSHIAEEKNHSFDGDSFWTDTPARRFIYSVESPGKRGGALLSSCVRLKHSPAGVGGTVMDMDGGVTM